MDAHASNHIYQYLSGFKSYQKLNLCIDSVQTGKIDVFANQKYQASMELSIGKNCIKINALELIENHSVEFKLVAYNDLLIDELKLYGFVQKLGLYDEFGLAGPNIVPIRKINKMLSNDVE